MTFHEQLMAQFPIRKKAKEKEAFRVWAVQQAQDAGWQAKVEESSGMKHRNVVIGDPEHAAVIFTAHYDTPANMVLPNLMLPRNIPLFICYTVLVVVLLLAVCGVIAGVLALLPVGREFARFSLLLAYFVMLYLMLMGPANRHNANDNTSGVAAVLEIMAAIPPEHRAKAAMILFDNEEKGCLGSKAYGRDHQQVQYTHLVINMDCVGVGENMLISSTKLARQCTGYNTMERILAEEKGCTAHFFDSKGTMGSSDHKNFKCGVGVFACRHLPVVGFYTPWIHTRRDTVCDQGNIDFLARGMSRFVVEMGEK